MRLDVNMKGLDSVKTLVEGLSNGKLQKAAVKAINDVAKFNVRRSMQDEMLRVFDRTTPYIHRSPQVRWATLAKPNAVIEPASTSTKTIDPQKVLSAQAWGGRRRDKSSEVILRRAGILPTGYQTAIPVEPFPGSEDGYGNIRGSFLVHLISYFRAYGEVGRGHNFNMGDRRRKAVHKRGMGKARAVGPQIGRRYIVSYGKLRGGARWTAKGENDRRASNLAPGIWAVVGRTGADIRPVLMFVRNGTYTPRLDMGRIAEAANVLENLQFRMRYHIREAAGQ